ncbi:MULTISPECIES: sigma-70 family RNA polymerase sigma factor [unclassified Rhodococcus (in: high G+C Gram-positive bacteria)]|nr:MULTISPECIES: sigma-70 family RNA polymerase sigma factor [unclassified Rhodococcus (in: high G+C Gram-positive bacteria)]MBF0663134.1 sigma-70 family RNA polymerase sigma factor [Rhodococcus sp. (in: high G+C Gram-positive bacteria)]NME78860.1 sigma-70 family RNA polymerase sigma factor [Rhodococcus sp. 105337]
MAYRNGSADREVGEALRQGDPAATARLYDLYAPGLFAYACGFVDASTASDVVHDSIWIAVRRIDALRDTGLLRAWLYAIVRSECAQPGRAAGTVGFVPATDPAAPPLRPQLYAVRDAVGSLGAIEREVLELAVRHHFTNQEIDAILGSAAGDGRPFARAQQAVDLAVPAVPNATGLFAAVPPVPLPRRLRDRVLTATPLDTELADMGRRIEPLNRNGFPVARRGRRKTAAIAAVAAVLVLAVVAVVVLPGSEPEELSAPPSPTSRSVDLPPSQTPVVTASPVSRSETPTTEPPISSTTAEPIVETTVYPGADAGAGTVIPVEENVVTTSARTSPPTSQQVSVTSTTRDITRYPRRTKPQDDSRSEDKERDERPATTPQPTTRATLPTTTRAAAP